MALPREGNLEAVFHVLLYLQEKHNSRLALDTTYPEIYHNSFKKHKWFEFYGDIEEAILTDMSEPRGKGVDLRIHVDSNHVGDKETHWSRTGFLIFMNTAFIQWISKKQLTIETSVFGPEFVATKHGIEKIRGI